MLISVLNLVNYILDANINFQIDAQSLDRLPTLEDGQPWKMAARGREGGEEMRGGVLLGVFSSSKFQNTAHPRRQHTLPTPCQPWKMAARGREGGEEMKGGVLLGVFSSSKFQNTAHPGRQHTPPLPSCGCQSLLQRTQSARGIAVKRRPIAV